MPDIIRQKFGFQLQLAEFLAEHELDVEIKVKKSEFPIVIPIENRPEGVFLHPHISLADFEPPDFITEINRILSWHDDFVHKGMDPLFTHTLRMSRTRLAKLLENLGVFSARLKKDFKDLEYKRRRVRDKMVLLKKSEGLTVGESQAHARLACEDYDEQVTEAERVWKEAEVLYDTVYQTLNAMAGEINALNKHKNSETHAERMAAPAA